MSRDPHEMSLLKKRLLGVSPVVFQIAEDGPTLTKFMSISVWSLAAFLPSAGDRQKIPVVSLPETWPLG